MPQLLLSKLQRRGRLALGALLLSGLAAAATVVQVAIHREPACAVPPAPGEPTKPGPWGELSCAPFTIAAPEEALPVRAMAARRTHWFFPEASEMDVRDLLREADVPSAMRDALVQPDVLRVNPQVADVAPSLAWLLELPAAARQQLYRRLAQIPANRGALTFIHKATLEERFAESGVASKTLDLFHRLCAEDGDYLVLSGLETMLAELPAYEEKVRFLKALTRQKTMLVQLHVGPESDVTALANYWGKGSDATDVRTKLQSFAKLKGGAWIDIMLLLPPLPQQEIYSYPISRENTDGGAPGRDCHWTSLNFFRQEAAPAFSDPKVIMEQFQREYRPAPGDPQYGDLVLLAKPDGTLVHSAIYVADDIVFTKNGATMIHPWMLSTTVDLLKRYSFEVPPGQHLTVSYRRKLTL